MRQCHDAGLLPPPPGIDGGPVNGAFFESFHTIPDELAQGEQQFNNFVFRESREAALQSVIMWSFHGHHFN